MLRARRIVMRKPHPDFVQPEDEQWLQERLGFEASAEARIPFAFEPRGWHQALAQVRRSLASSADHATALLKLPARRPKRGSGPNWAAIEPAMASAEGFRNNGQLLVPRQGSHTFRVSLMTYKRALAIANAVLYAAEARGFRTAHDETQGRLQLHFEDCCVQLSIRERQGISSVRSASGEMTTVFEATDRLALAVDRSHRSAFELRDVLDEPLEQRLSELFCRLYPVIVLGRQFARENEAKRQRHAEVWARYEEITRQRAEEKQAAVVEHGRREDLVAEAARWHQATQIRAYVAHLDARGTPDSEWRSWALRVADEMDPTPGRLATPT
jgi:hypothetical protein